MMIMDDLLCTEESVTLLQDETNGLAPPAIDSAEALDMMLQQEARGGRVARNAQYLADVQRHGMEATWRRKICHWMFEVRPIPMCISKSFILYLYSLATIISFVFVY